MANRELFNLLFAKKRHICFKTGKSLSLEILHELIKIKLIFHGILLPVLIIIELALLSLLDLFLFLLFFSDLLLDFSLFIIVEVVQHALNE